MRWLVFTFGWLAAGLARAQEPAAGARLHHVGLQLERAVEGRARLVAPLAALEQAAEQDVAVGAVVALDQVLRRRDGGVEPLVRALDLARGPGLLGVVEHDRDAVRHRERKYAFAKSTRRVEGFPE